MFSWLLSFVVVATAGANNYLNSLTTEDVLALLKEWKVEHAFGEVGCFEFEWIA